MPKRNQSSHQVPDETAELRNRLEETEETLRAIRQYMVDAFVVTREDGEQVVTLNDADFPYRTMVESMNEGAVTLISDGTIFYSNPRFGEMVQMARGAKSPLASVVTGSCAPDGSLALFMEAGTVAPGTVSPRAPAFQTAGSGWSHRL